MKSPTIEIIERSDGEFLTSLRERILDKDQVFLHHPGSVFGLAANAFSLPALNRIRDWKGRVGEKGFIVLIPGPEWLADLGVELNRGQARLLSQYWPGNLTVVLKCPDPRLQHLAVDGKVAFRVPVALRLRGFLAELGAPIVSTSVNRSGEAPLEDLRLIRQNCADAFDFALLYKREYLEDPVPSTVISFHDQKPVCLREGAIPYVEIEASWEQPLITFVCTANICRSPMGEYWLRYLLQQRKLPYRTASVGFLRGGVPISENSRSVLAENGIDASRHLSTQLNPELLRASWRILTMTSRHRDDLRSGLPNLTQKVFTLSEFTGFDEEVSDPYGQSIDVYRQTFVMVRERCARLLEKLGTE